jgi:RNA 2',3'-cyclic 3'-phosphodiesterase
MRCFVAIDIPKNIKKIILKIQKQLPEFGGKFTEVENLHLTLKFLGGIDNDVISRVKELLAQIKIRQFEIIMNSIGIFSDRIVWLNVENCDELQKEVDEKLKKLFEKENRFMGHLTIARIKTIDDKKEFRSKLKQIKIPKMKFIVKDFILKKSKLTRNGPIYENLKIYPLEKPNISHQ